MAVPGNLLPWIHSILTKHVPSVLADLRREEHSVFLNLGSHW